ncbi:MAG: primosomal protein N' [Alphaproteobacteria bacterium]
MASAVGAQMTMLSEPERATYIEAIVTVPIFGRFTYALPGGVDAPRGAILAVPFGARTELALSLGDAGEVLPAGIAREKIKAVARLMPAPPLHEELVQFIEWVARYTCAPAGAVLAQVLRSPAALELPPTEIWYRVKGGALPRDLRLTPARARAIAVVRDGLARPLAALAEEAGVSAAVVRGLIDHGVLTPEERRADAVPLRPDPSRPGPALSRAQDGAASALKSAVARGGYSAFLLDGVTGSGKTEVYFEAIAEAVRAGKQSLVLLPEIALTAQFLARFATRFGCPPVTWHSDVSSLERRRAWRAVAEGTADVVVGARSALFFRSSVSGSSLSMRSTTRVSSRRTVSDIRRATWRSFARASPERRSFWPRRRLPSRPTSTRVTGASSASCFPARHGQAQMPKVRLVDLRRAAPESGHWLSPPLVDAIVETLAKKEQALLFLNRRGYAPLTLCRACGHRMMSPHAASWLVEHRFTHRLVCHVTGFSMPKPAACPACGKPGTLAACGPGVERIAEEVTERFPEAKVAVASSDMFAGPAAAQEVFEAMKAGAIDILIGTQIVAKGHHFPSLTLVGVIDADLGLSGGDLRAAERTYQLLHQVSGRAGAPSARAACCCRPI